MTKFSWKTLFLCALIFGQFFAHGVQAQEKIDASEVAPPPPSPPASGVVITTDQAKGIKDELEALRALVKELQQTLVTLKTTQNTKTRIEDVENVAIVEAAAPAPPINLGESATKLGTEDVQTILHDPEVAVAHNQRFPVTHETPVFGAGHTKSSPPDGEQWTIGHNYPSQEGQLISSHQDVAGSIPVDGDSAMKVSIKEKEAEEAAVAMETAILNPKARLYSGPNFSGVSEDYNPPSATGQQNGGCTNLRQLQTVQSIETFGTCVRLYDKENCLGHSMSFYPKPKTHSGIDSGLEISNKKLQPTRVRSAGPCFENELDHGAMEKSPDGHQTFRKLKGRNGIPIVPDLVFFGLGPRYDIVPHPGPISWYSTGINGRMESVTADVEFNDVIRARMEAPQRSSNAAASVDPTSMVPKMISQEDKKYYDQLPDKQEGDQVGQFICPAFGPQRILPFRNIFPQNQQNFQMMSRLENDVIRWLSGPFGVLSGVRATIYVDYENSTSTRPTGMSYIINFGAGPSSIRRMRYVSNQLRP